MNAFGKVAMCGMISGYDGASIPLQQPGLVLRSRLKVQGFIIGEHPEVWPEALEALGSLVSAGKLKHRESVSHGLETAPGSLLGLLKGKNFGQAARQTRLKAQNKRRRFDATEICMKIRDSNSSLGGRAVQRLACSRTRPIP